MITMNWKKQTTTLDWIRLFAAFPFMFLSGGLLIVAYWISGGKQGIEMRYGPERND